jgi:hypothetical protein
MCARRAKVKIVSKIRSAKILAVDTRIVPSQKNIAFLRVQSPSNRGSRVLNLPKEIELDGGAFYGVELVSDTQVLGTRRWSLNRAPPPLAKAHPPSVNFYFHPPVISRTAIDRVMMGLYAAAALFVKNDAAFMEDEKRSPAFAQMGRGNNGRR